MPRFDTAKLTEVAFVVKAQDYLLYLEGLPTAKIDDVIITRNGGRALITALNHGRIEALMLDRERPAPGDAFIRNEKGIQIPFESKLLGRAITPLGKPIDGKDTFPPKGEKIILDRIAGGIDTRRIISDQFYTGITMIDTLLPIGKGQRELVFGEARSGKSTLLQDIILNQKGKNVICIYVAIGISDIEVKRFINSLEQEGGLSYSIIIAATSSNAAPLIAIAPTVGFAMAEHFLTKGRDVLMILDDLGMHAKYMREIGLLSGRIPGRESYPADIFYAHSHLVERAGNFNQKFGNASITLLPVIETGLENFSNLIPTNVMSMTDGHLLFSSTLRSQGFYPPVDYERSVTRVGHQTQIPLRKIIAEKIRSLLSEYHELERFGRFGSELTAETQSKLRKGMIILELLRQEPMERIDPTTQILLLSLIFTKFFEEKDVEFVRRNKGKILEYLKNSPEFQLIGEQSLTSDFDTFLNNMNGYLEKLNSLCQ